MAVIYLRTNDKWTACQKSLILVSRGHEMLRSDKKWRSNFVENETYPPLRILDYCKSSMNVSSFG